MVVTGRTSGRIALMGSHGAWQAAWRRLERRGEAATPAACGDVTACIWLLRASAQLITHPWSRRASERAALRRRTGHDTTMAVNDEAGPSAAPQVTVSQLVLDARDGNLEAVTAAIALPAPTSVRRVPAP